MNNKSVLYLLLFICLFAINPVNTAENPNNNIKRILLLNSYHKGYQWSDEIIRGVEETIANSNQKSKIELHIEYMDTKRQFSNKYQNLINQTLRFKFLRHKYDLIITCDNNAFNFIRNNDKLHFANVPVVFCGVNYIKRNDFKGYEQFTGVNESIDLPGNIAVIEKLHKNCKRIYVITDDTTTGKKVQDELQHIISIRNPKAPKIVIIHDTSIPKLKETIRNLNTTDIVLFTFFLRDNTGNSFESNVTSNIIAQNSAVPVYSTYFFSMKKGMIGGSLICGFDQGKIATEMALEILNGRKPKDIPIHFKTPTKFIFDYQELMRHEIQKDLLPDNSTIINEPHTLFRDHKNIILFTIFIIIVLAIALLSASWGLLMLKKANIALKETQSTTHQILDKLPVGLILIDANYIIRQINKAALELIGENDESNIVGKKCHKLVCPREDCQCPIPNLDKTFSSKEAYLLTKNGNSIPILKTIIQIIVNKELLLIECFIDIREQKELEKITKDYQQHLEKEIADRTLDLAQKNLQIKENHKLLLHQEKMASIGQLAAGVAHELNNPAGFVMSNMGTMLEYVTILHKLFNEYNILDDALNSKDIEKQKFHQRRIAELKEKEDLEFVLSDINQALTESKQGIKRIKDIVQNLKSFARLDDGKFKLLNINSVIEKTLKLVQNELKYKCDVKTDLEALPLISGCMSELYQVFTNLLVNAAQAIPEHGEIKIHTKCVQNQIVIKISDTGKGISADHLTKLFDPFFTTKEVGEGTGLGLSITHGIIDKHKGNIEVISKLGEGTTFIIYFPIEEAGNEFQDSIIS